MRAQDIQTAIDVVTGLVGTQVTLSDGTVEPVRLDSTLRELLFRFLPPEHARAQDEELFELECRMARSSGDVEE